MTRPSDWGVRTKTPKEVTDKVENIVRKSSWKNGSRTSLYSTRLS